jgi:hypothetical protein
LPRTTSYRWHLTTYPEAMPISCAGVGSFGRYSRPRRSSMRPSSDTGPARHPFWASLAHDPDRICAAVLGYRHYCRDCLARAHARYLAARCKRPSGSRPRNEGRLRAIKASRLSACATGRLRRLGREILGFPRFERASARRVVGVPPVNCLSPQHAATATSGSALLGRIPQRACLDSRTRDCTREVCAASRPGDRSATC